MPRINDILFELLKKYPQVVEQLNVNLIKIWKEAFNKPISEISRPAYLKDNILIVFVKDPVWKKELTLRKKEIIKTINEAVKAELIKDIEFELDKDPHIPKKATRINNNLDENIEKAIDKTLMSVKDKELRKVLKSIFIKSVSFH